MLTRLLWLMLLAFPLMASCGFFKETSIQMIELGQISSEGLSSEQAEQILNYVLEHEKIKPNLPRTFLEPHSLAGGENSPFSIYYTFMLYHSDPNAAALSNLGWFAVSRFTGDVFEIWSCKRFQFSVLLDLQEKIMIQTGKTIKDEEKYHEGMMDCEEGLSLQGKFPSEPA